jgi:hypothetical protein
MSANYFCALCVSNQKTCTHLFIEGAIWERIATWSHCPNLQPSQWAEVSDLKEWFLALTRAGSKTAHTLAILTPSLLISLVYCAEITVRWFVVREKHCWMAADSADKSKRTGR